MSRETTQLDIEYQLLKTRLEATRIEKEIEAERSKIEAISFPAPLMFVDMEEKFALTLPVINSSTKKDVKAFAFLDKPPPEVIDTNYSTVPKRRPSLRSVKSASSASISVELHWLISTYHSGNCYYSTHHCSYSIVLSIDHSSRH